MASSLGWADYLVCGIMLAISTGIGIYYRFSGGKQKTNKEFLFANRNAGIVPVAFSLMATFMSSITLLGVSSEIYTFGTMFVIINVSYGIFTIFAAFLYLPVFFKLQATSAYEYLERRFGRTTRLTASIAFSLQMVLYMGIVLYAPALALEAVTGLDLVAAILVIGIVCTFYATVGGMKAVLMTDVFQSLLMFAAVFCVVISALIEKGGFKAIWDISLSGERIEFLAISPDPTVRHTWWTQVLGGGVLYLSLYAVNQAQVQRYLSTKNLKSAQKSLFLNWPILTLLSFSTSFAGLSMFSKYAECDPLLTKRITSSDQLMPLYVLDTLGHLPGLPGLFIAGIFSGSLSTISGALNSLSAVTVEDYLKPVIKHCTKQELRESSSAYLTKLFCIIYGGCSIALAFAAQYLGGILQAALTIFGVVGGPLLGVFTLGMFFPPATEMGAVAGLLSGLSLSLWIGFGGPRPPAPVLPTWASDEGCSPWNMSLPLNFHNGTTPVFEPSDYMYLYRISYQWYGMFGLLVTLAVGLTVSWLSVMTKLCPASQDLHPDLFIPPVSRHLAKKRHRNTEIFSLETSKAVTVIKRTSNCDDEQLKARIMPSTELKSSEN